MKKKSDYCAGCGVRFTGFTYWPTWTRALVDTGFCWGFFCQRCANREDTVR